MENRVIYCIICGDSCTKDEILIVPGKEGCVIEICEVCHKNLWRYFDTLGASEEKG